MKRALVLVIALCAVGGARADESSDRTGRLLGKLHAGANCDDKASPLRPWCFAADGWAKAKAAPLPKATVLVGVTVTLVEGDVVETELREKVTLSALAFKVDGAHTYVKLASITPSNDDENLQIMKAVGGVSMVLKGKAKKVALPKGLADYVASLPAAASHELAKTDAGWSWMGDQVAAELRKVGDVWVVIEPSDKGMYVTVLTDKL